MAQLIGALLLPVLGTILIVVYPGKLSLRTHLLVILACALSSGPVLLILYGLVPQSIADEPLDKVSEARRILVAFAVGPYLYFALSVLYATGYAASRLIDAAAWVWRRSRPNSGGK